MTEDSRRRRHPSAGLTLFGRKPALEALMDPLLEIHCLHLANSNRSGGIITQILTEAERRGRDAFPRSSGTLAYFQKRAPGSRRGARCYLPRLSGLDAVLASSTPPKACWLLMASPIHKRGHDHRSAVAAGIDGVLYPQRGIASLDPSSSKPQLGRFSVHPLSAVTPPCRRSRR